MNLPNDALHGFLVLAREKNFSKAAARLHISQPALSQRIKKLEVQLGITLFIRNVSGLKLTEAGEKLLRYCRTKELFEYECLKSLTSGSQIMGEIRLAGFSTITQSIVLPAIATLLHATPSVQFSLFSKELHELPQLLHSAAADFIFSTRPISRQGLMNELLGYEEYVLIQPNKKNFPRDIYLDHDEEDTTTYDFFKLQRKHPSQIRRYFLDEIYLIISGVELGIGCAVVPKHLLLGNRKITILKHLQSLKLPVYLVYYAQQYYTRLQCDIISVVKDAFKKILPK